MVEVGGDGRVHLGSRRPIQAVGQAERYEGHRCFLVEDLRRGPDRGLPWRRQRPGLSPRRQTPRGLRPRSLERSGQGASSPGHHPRNERAPAG
eukprot:9017241-Pyramimonas_sp.AAC.1